MLEPPASPEQEEDLDPRDPRVLLDQEALLEILVPLVSREIPVSRESPDTPDLREPPDLRVRRAREDPLASPVPPALLDSVELEVLAEAVECPDPREELALLVCPEPVVPLVPLAHVDPPEMPVVLVSLV